MSPAASKAQARLMAARYHRGEITREELEEWMSGYRQLPERVKRRPRKRAKVSGRR